MDFIESIAEETGLPVGIKGAIGKVEQWMELADLMKRRGKARISSPLMVVRVERVRRLQVLPTMFRCLGPMVFKSLQSIQGT